MAKYRQVFTVVARVNQLRAFKPVDQTVISAKQIVVAIRGTKARKNLPLGAEHQRRHRQCHAFTLGMYPAAGQLGCVQVHQHDSQKALAAIGLNQRHLARNQNQRNTAVRNLLDQFRDPRLGCPIEQG